VSASRGEGRGGRRRDDDAAARARRVNEERFTATARSYSSSAIAARQDENEVLLRLAAPTPADLALDVACGPGAVLAALAPFVHHAAGIDLTAAMLEQARRRLPAGTVSLVRGAAERLPFLDGVFSFAVTTYTLHHFGEPRLVVREMARVVGAGGRVIVGDLVGDDDDRARALQNEIERLRDPAHIEMESVRGIEALLASAGLTVTGRAEGARDRELGEWLRLAHTPSGAGARVRDRLLESLPGDRAGMAPRLDGETVRFVHRWAIVAARKP
jgi:ubiquinone/menaquinone biosynthesis C-methylase UbiE